MTASSRRPSWAGEVGVVGQLWLPEGRATEHGCYQHSTSSGQTGEGTGAEKFGRADRMLGAACEKKRSKVWHGGGDILDPEKGDGNEWCLPNAVSVVSSCLG